jgi:hypothetical protein
MTDTITLSRADAEQIREALSAVQADVKMTSNAYEAQRQAISILNAALAEPPVKPEPVAFAKNGNLFWCGDASQMRGVDIDLYLAPPKPDAIARAVEAAVKECVTICERQRVRILKNPTDPSWTEHLAEVQNAMKQRFGVDMGHPTLAEPEPDATREPATEEVIQSKFEASFYVHPEALDDFTEGWCEAERWHGIRKEDK